MCLCVCVCSSCQSRSLRPDFYDVQRPSTPPQTSLPSRPNCLRCASENTETFSSFPPLFARHKSSGLTSRVLSFPRGVQPSYAELSLNFIPHILLLVFLPFLSFFFFWEYSKPATSAPRWSSPGQSQVPGRWCWTWRWSRSTTSSTSEAAPSFA